MPPQQLINMDNIDLENVIFNKKDIMKHNPQDFEMQQLDGILWYDKENFLILGYKDITEKEFWTRGHIPGRPIMPGVIMVEASAQISSFFVKEIYELSGFIGFASIESAKFRGTVEPGSRMYMQCHISKFKRRKYTAVVQGFVNGKMVYDCVVSGLNV